MKVAATITSTTPTRELLLRLPQNGHLRLEDAAGVSLRVECGMLWVTQAGDLDDHVIQSGSSFTVNREGLILISAEAETEFSMVRELSADTAITKLLRQIPPRVTLAMSA